MIDKNQPIEIHNYTKMYTVSDKLHPALLKCLASYPYNTVKNIITVFNQPEMDEAMVSNALNALSQFPYDAVYPILDNITDFISEQ